MALLSQTCSLWLAAVISLLAVGGTLALPSASVSPWARHARHVAASTQLHAAISPPAREPPQLPQLQEIDPVDKCLFTCDYCYKQTKTLLACANECIMTAGDGSMGRVWLETCPFFAQPIYFDYQPV